MSDDAYRLGLAAGLGLMALTEYPTLSLAWRTLPRDARGIWKLGWAMRSAMKAQANNITMTELFRDTVKANPNKVRMKRNIC